MNTINSEISIKLYNTLITDLNNGKIKHYLNDSKSLLEYLNDNKDNLLNITRQSLSNNQSEYIINYHIFNSVKIIIDNDTRMIIYDRLVL